MTSGWIEEAKDAVQLGTVSNGYWRSMPFPRRTKRANWSWAGGHRVTSVPTASQQIYSVIGRLSSLAKFMGLWNLSSGRFRFIFYED